MNNLLRNNKKEKNTRPNQNYQSIVKFKLKEINSQYEILKKLVSVNRVVTIDKQNTSSKNKRGTDNKNNTKPFSPRNFKYQNSYIFGFSLLKLFF